jgi:hypothetical protein
VTAVLGVDGPDWWYVPDLMAQRLWVVAMQRLATVAASQLLAVVDGVGMIDECTLGLVMPLLTTRFVGGRRLGWRAFEGRWVGRRWLGGVGGVLVESGFEVG